MPLMIWATHVLQWCRTKGSKPARGSESHKRHPSSDCTLQPGCTKLESLVIADQHAAVNTFPGLVHTARHTMGVRNTRTARHTMGVRNTRNQWPNPQGRELLKVGRMTGVKS